MSWSPGPNRLRLAVSPDTTVVVVMPDAAGFASTLRGIDVGYDGDVDVKPDGLGGVVDYGDKDGL